MTPQQKRGMYLFLLIAGLIVLDKVSSVALTLMGDWGEIRWWSFVLLPLGVAIGVAAMWWGDNQLRWISAGVCILSGVERIYVCSRIYLAIAAKDAQVEGESVLSVFLPSLLAVAVPGALYVLAGLSFLFSRSMLAFFQYQSGSDTVKIRLG